MSLATKYSPKEIENKWYDYWMKNNYFHSTPNEKEPYTIVIPPPNVTGVLHMGHMLNNAIQDVLIRRARLKGFNACWVPGTDHASIATEAKVVAKLKEQGIQKSDLTREEFLKYAWMPTCTACMCWMPTARWSAPAHAWLATLQPPPKTRQQPPARPPTRHPRRPHRHHDPEPARRHRRIALRVVSPGGVAGAHDAGRRGHVFGHGGAAAHPGRF